MEWMYDGDKSEVNKEEYLLGKSIDKGFEGTLGQINAVEYDCTPASIFSSSADHQVDIERKIVEDPLVALRKKELETRKKLLDNPIKMKEINKYISKMKKKKKKHKRDHGSEENDDEEEINRKLLKKLGGMKSGDSPSQTDSSRSPSPDNRRRRRLDSSESECSSSNERRRSKKHRESRSRNSPREKNRSRHSHHRKRSPSHSRKRERSRSRDSHRRSKRSPSRERSRKHSSDKPRKKSRSSSPVRSYKGKKSSREDKGGRGKSSSDREKKLQEMMENAVWRDDKRKENVKKSLEENKQATSDHEKNFNPDFIRKQLSKAVESGSVAKRLNSNRHHVQKGANIMDTNFARK